MTKLNAILVLLLILTSALSIIVLNENMQLKDRLETERCTEQGACMGDVVYPSSDAKKYLTLLPVENMSSGMIIKKVGSNGVLVLQLQDGSYQVLSEYWVTMRKI
jgi:hypothetical protein